MGASERLRPYPLAPGDPLEPSTPDARDDPPEPAAAPRTVPRRLVVALVLVLLLALTAVAGLLGLRLVAQGRVVTDQEALLEELADELLAKDQALRAAAGEPMSRLRANSPEVVAAAAGVQRFATTGPAVGIDPASATEQFVTNFFATPMESTNWTFIQRGEDVTTVLARLDDPAAPSTIWVSRRSLRTVDQGVPARTDCIALDVAAVVDSVVRKRAPGPAQPGAPLRWWTDVVRFVPPEECPR